MPRITRVVGRNLVKAYGSTVALRSVSVTFSAGQVCLVEGANGSGKSTLLGILGTVIRPTSGTVVYEPIGDDLMLVRGALGWVSHDTLAYPDLTGRKNVELAARLFGIDEREAWERASSRFELGSFALRPVRTYSRGQRQRLALARALLHEPSLVLLDEPTTGLDKGSVGRLLSVVAEEVARGAAVVVVSHEPELFREQGGARIVLERGRVVEAPISP
jgi:ABC-type multidrug transport system ATPase subunit